MGVENNGRATAGIGGITGRGFVPGQSGNPGGRPKGLAVLVREATADGQNPIDFLVKVLEGRIKGVKVEHRIAAARELLDRGHGKATQQVEAKVESPPDLDLIEIPTDVLLELVAAIRSGALQAFMESPQYKALTEGKKALGTEVHGRRG